MQIKKKKALTVLQQFVKKDHGKTGRVLSETG